jgi:hypothetical protein
MPLNLQILRPACHKNLKAGVTVSLADISPV